jgi:hypothetical protein
VASRRKADESAAEDPTITSSESIENDGSTHPARPASEVTHSADRLEYRDNPDKPDESSVAQLVDIPEDFPGQQ